MVEGIRRRRSHICCRWWWCDAAVDKKVSTEVARACGHGHCAGNTEWHAQHMLTAAANCCRPGRRSLTGFADSMACMKASCADSRSSCGPVCVQDERQAVEEQEGSNSVCVGHKASIKPRTHDNPCVQLRPTASCTWEHLLGLCCDPDWGKACGSIGCGLVHLWRTAASPQACTDDGPHLRLASRWWWLRQQVRHDCCDVGVWQSVIGWGQAWSDW